MIGIDTAMISRIESAVAKDAFKRSVFTDGEQAYCDKKARPAQSYAGIFCVKEATVKALGCGFGRGVSPKDVEIVHDELGAPKVLLHGGAKAAADGKIVHVSISHDGDYAVGIAMVCGE